MRGAEDQAAHAAVVPPVEQIELRAASAPAVADHPHPGAHRCCAVQGPVHFVEPTLTGAAAVCRRGRAAGLRLGLEQGVLVIEEKEAEVDDSVESC